METSGSYTAAFRFHDDGDDDYVYDDDGGWTGEESNMCTVSGPVGAGKTAAIYACAEELGFNVIEVS